jgi:hypothetical protein
MNFSRLQAAERISPTGGAHQNGRAGGMPCPQRNLPARPTCGAPTMTSKIRAAMFWCGLLIYVFSLSLAAIVEVNLATVRPGYVCALLSAVAVAMIGNLFRFHSSALESILESASILFTGAHQHAFLALCHRFSLSARRPNSRHFPHPDPANDPVLLSHLPLRKLSSPRRPCPLDFWHAHGSRLRARC